MGAEVDVAAANIEPRYRRNPMSPFPQCWFQRPLFAFRTRVGHVELDNLSAARGPLRGRPLARAGAGPVSVSRSPTFGETPDRNAERACIGDVLPRGPTHRCSSDGGVDYPAHLSARGSGLWRRRRRARHAPRTDVECRARLRRLLAINCSVAVNEDRLIGQNLRGPGFQIQQIVQLMPGQFPRLHEPSSHPKSIGHADPSVVRTAIAEDRKVLAEHGPP